MDVVRGVLLDESVLVAGDVSVFSPAIALLLRRLQYSNLRVGICHREYRSPQKASFLKRAAESYSFDILSLDASESSIASLKAWKDTEETCVYVTSTEDEILNELKSEAWRIFYINSGTKLTNRQEYHCIDKLEDLPIAVCNFNTKVASDQSFLTIGYVMKQSREEDFAKRGAFPIYPTPNGLMFVPITLDHPLTTQLHEVDAILHKATDEIISFDPLASDISEGVLFSKGMHELERYTKGHPDCCLIDTLSNTYPLLDRLKIQDVLKGVENLSISSCNRIRSPYFLKIDNFGQLNLESLSKAKLSFPVIVKPRVACGVADAHNMALVFKLEEIQVLSVPLPAIAQEFVDHGSSIFKFYVLGDKVFHAVKKSIPNASVLSSSSQKSASSPIIFNSLKSLPISKEDHHPMGGSNKDKQSLDEDLVKYAACWLRKKLNLTIFGFDVVIQEGTGDHVIVDLNYLPSFKEIPNGDAIPAFWDAIRSTYERYRTLIK